MVRSVTLRIAGGCLAASLCVVAAAAEPELPAETEANRSVALTETPGPALEDISSLYQDQLQSCVQRCDSQARATILACRRTIAQLQQNPTWLDETLDGDVCEPTAATGKAYCYRSCQSEPSGYDAQDEARPLTEVE